MTAYVLYNEPTITDTVFYDLIDAVESVLWDRLKHLPVQELILAIGLLVTECVCTAVGSVSLMTPGVRCAL